MAVGLSETNIDLILEWFGNIGTPTRPVDTWFIAWHVGDPGAAGTANPATTLTARDALAGSNPFWALDGGTVGQMSNTAAGESSTAAAGGPELITHFSVWTLVSAGVFSFSGTVVTPQNVAENGKLTYGIGDLKVSITGAS